MKAAGKRYLALLLTLLMIVLIVGCGKKAEPSAEEPTEETVPPAEEPTEETVPSAEEPVEEGRITIIDSETP